MFSNFITGGQYKSNSLISITHLNCRSSAFLSPIIINFVQNLLFGYRESNRKCKKTRTEKQRESHQYYRASPSIKRNALSPFQTQTFIPPCSPLYPALYHRTLLTVDLKSNRSYYSSCEPSDPSTSCYGHYCVAFAL